MTVEGSRARPTPRKSPSVATSIVRSSATAASTRACKRIQRLGDVRSGKLVAFRPKRGELLLLHRFAARVREQAIDDPGHVPDVKRRRRHAGGAGVPFGFRQVLDQFTDTFANLQKNVRDGLQDGGNAIDGTALPPLGIRHVRPGFMVVLMRHHWNRRRGGTGIVDTVQLPGRAAIES